MTRPFQALIFDLDGTLVDSAPGLCVSINQVLTENGLRQISLEETKGLIGWGARNLVEKAFALTGKPGTTADIDRFLEDFLTVYALHAADGSKPFPGTFDALEHCRAKGYLMGMCTNKPQAATDSLLDAVGLEPYFDAVFGGDSVPHKKPDGRHVLHVVEALGATIEKSAMIGDSENDITAAINAGVKSVAVTFGYAHVPHDELGADALIDHFDDLAQALMDIAP